MITGALFADISAFLYIQNTKLVEAFDVRKSDANMAIFSDCLLPIIHLIDEVRRFCKGDERDWKRFSKASHEKLDGDVIKRLEIVRRDEEVINELFGEILHKLQAFSGYELSDAQRAALKGFYDFLVRMMKSLEENKDAVQRAEAMFEDELRGIFQVTDRSIGK